MAMTSIQESQGSARAVAAFALNIEMHCPST